MNNQDSTAATLISVFEDVLASEKSDDISFAINTFSKIFMALYYKEDSSTAIMCPIDSLNNPGEILNNMGYCETTNDMTIALEDPKNGVAIVVSLRSFIKS